MVRAFVPSFERLQGDSMLTALLLLTVSADLPRIGVMDFQAGDGASTDVAQAVSTIVSQELERLEIFRVSSAQTTRVMLGVERQRQLMGCDSCTAASLSDLADFEFVITGKIVKTKSDITLLMTLLPVGSTHPASSSRVTAASDSKLLSEVGPAAVKLVGKMLEGKQGSTLVTSSEVAAAVKVDDTQVGTTPLPGPIKLAGGPHLVSVEKDGFTLSRREVKVVPDQLSEQHFTLVPNPDTIKEYETRAGNTRILAWGSAGLAVVGVSLFVLGELRADSIYGAINSPGTFLFHQAALTAGRETDLSVDGKVINHRLRAIETANAVQTWQAVSIASLIVGGAAAVTSVVLFVIGAPPEKYEAFHAQLGATLGGFVLAGGF
jgi:hypothetical protein